MVIIDLVSKCFGLFARECAPHQYAIYVAEGEGFGAGEPWSQLPGSSGELLLERCLKALLLHDSVAEIIDPPKDDMVVVLRIDSDTPELVSEEEVWDYDPEQYQGGENGDYCANPITRDELSIQDKS